MGADGIMRTQMNISYGSRFKFNMRIQLYLEYAVLTARPCYGHAYGRTNTYL
eukprot:SAG31_NODE_236_length_19594_cov_7.018620_15_plen_52_part_00